MCRLLAVASAEPVDPSDLLAAFAERSRSSEEYQGHGWGVACVVGSQWRRHRSIRPIWEDVMPSLPSSRLWIAHARSAFRNEGIVVENNMPFLREGLAFAFNGELRGVRLSVPGETGAARLLELLSRFRSRAEGGLGDALRRLDTVTAARSSYVRALNVLAATPDRVAAHCRYGEDPAYFTLHRAEVELPGAGEEGGTVTAAVVSSEPLELPGQATRWTPFDNGETWELALEESC